MGQPQYQERRTHGREQTRLLAELRYDDKHLRHLMITNVSLGGVYVSTGDRAKPENGQEISLTVSDVSGESSCSLTGRVVRVNADGVGIVFTKFSVDDYERILRMGEYYGFV